MARTTAGLPHSAGTASARVAVVLGLVAVFLGFLVGGTAYAAGPAVWDSPAPAPGSVSAVSNPLIRVHVDDAASINASASTLKVDGRYFYGKFSYDLVFQGWLEDAYGDYWATVYDYTAGTFSYRPSSLAIGPHTVEARIRTYTGSVSTYTWTFTVQPAPALRVTTPVPGSVVQTQTPQIALAVTGIADTTSLQVDGVTVPAVYNPAAGTLTYTPSSPLVNGVDHVISASVSNAYGSDSKAWSFHIQVYSSMPSDSASCVECHPGMPSPNHPMGDCYACHNATNSPVGPYEGTPPAGTHAASWLAAFPGGCAGCHNERYALIPRHGDLDVRHLSDQDITDCQICHEASLTIEHYRSDGTRTPYTCADCHASSDPVVSGAVDAGDSRCNTCHDFASHPGLGESHTSTVAGDALAGVTPTVLCGDCHRVELADEHGRTTSVTGSSGCGACHPTPRDTLSSWDGSCSQGGCHAAGSPQEMHGQVAGAHVIVAQNESCAIAGCHDAGGLDAIHAAASTTDGSATLESCLVCHSTASMPSNACSDCHTDLSVPGHDAVPHDADLTAELEQTGKTCAECHQTDVRVEHGRTTSSSFGGQCGTCHPSPRDTLDPWNLTCVEGGCHVPGSGTEMHAGVAGAHTAPSSADACTGSGCHDEGDVAAIHTNAESVDTGGLTVTSCSVCHSATSVPATTDCTVCHGTDFATIHPNVAAAHTASESGSISYGTASAPCTQCHYMDIATEHGKSTSNTAGAGCGACHPAVLNSITLPWNDSCAACHNGAVAPVAHGAFASAHIVARSVRNNCADCHGSGAMDTRLHRTCANVGPSPDGGPGGCHVGPAPANMPWTSDCRTCHPTE